ncbi:MAG: HEAT repeat domain-containing protein [Myxococcales bacterium]|nr:HEAT repeat domain-containing protein [Myxococcales bacterium]
MSDARDAAQRGLALARQGNKLEALLHLLAAAADVDADPRDYDAVVRVLVEAYRALQRPRELATLSWLETADPKLGGPADVARAHRLLGDEAAAARSFEDAGMLAHAAVCRERAHDPGGARALWSRLAHELSRNVDQDRTASHDRAERAAERAYVLGLVRFDVARNAPRESRDKASREAIVAAIGALEDAAQRFESLGLRERAFDAYQAMAAIGENSRTFEHVVEGRVNSIRILREDHLQQYALSQYDEAIAVAEAHHELAAAAELAREATAYARGLGAAPETYGYARRAMELHAAAGRLLAKNGAPPELTENAYLAAIGLSAELDLLGTAAKLYTEAATIPDLDETRQARHQRAAQRLRGAVDTGPADVRDRGARPAGAALEVWTVDVIEWEQAGRGEEIAAEIYFDAVHAPNRGGASLPARRRAIAARLAALAVAGIEPDTTEGIKLAENLVARLAEMVDYRVMSALEALASHGSASVRARVAEAAGTMPFKRSAQLLRRAARDDARDVIAAVGKAVARKQSAVFVDPLRRLAREAQHAEIRAAALRALSSIDNAEAANAVLSVLEAGAAEERLAVVEALKRRRPDPNSQLVTLGRERLARGLSAEVAAELRVALGI